MKHNLSQLAILKKSLNLLVIVAMLFGMIGPAFAEESPITNQQEQEADYTELLKEVEAQKIRYEHAVQQMERHIYVGKDGLFHLEVESGTALGIDEEIYEELGSALARTNDLIASGKLALEEIAFADGRNIFGEEVRLDNAGYMVSCAGWTGVIYTWQGPRVFLNDCHTQTLIYLIGVGAGLATICAAIGALLQGYPIALVCGLVAGVLAVGAGALGAVNSWGGFQGLWFQLDWTYNLLYFWHQ
jgi:hypothetical protein